jgi:exopolyphosphatase/guanosine-5'-triphosphate,3'-diphosphate pyrophosphatase
MRADMIVPASIQVNLVLNEFQLKEMKLSTHALKEGVLAQLLQKY